MWRAERAAGRVGWGCVLLAMLALLAYLLFFLLSNFIQSPTTSSIAVTVSKQPPNYPDVVICQENPKYKAEVLNRYNVTMEFLQKIEVLSKVKHVKILEIMKWAKEEMFRKEYSALLDRLPNRDIRQLYFQAGLTCNELITGKAACKGDVWPRNRGKSLKRIDDCCLGSRPVFDSVYGSCILLPLRRVCFNQVSEELRFRVVINITSNYTLQSEDGREAAAAGGFILRVMKEYSPLNQDASLLPTGMRVSMDLVEERHVAINPTFAQPKCVEDGRGMNVGEQRAACTFIPAVRLCGSSPAVDDAALEILDLPPFRIMEPADLLDCYTKRRVFAGLSGIQTEKNVDDATSMCYYNALPSCTVSYSRKSIGYSRLLEQGSENALDFDIGNRPFQTTEIREVNTMTFSNVVSSVGGCLGICLGASLVTVVEVFAFLLSKLFVKS